MRWSRIKLTKEEAASRGVTNGWSAKLGSIGKIRLGRNLSGRSLDTEKPLDAPPLGKPWTKAGRMDSCDVEVGPVASG